MVPARYPRRARPPGRLSRRYGRVRPARSVSPAPSALSLFLALPGLQDEHIDRLLMAGVERVAFLRSALGRPSPIHCARVAAACGRFVFDPARAERDGVTAYLFLALDRCGDPVDLVAWRPGPAGFLASRFGRVAMLGEELIGAPAAHTPLAVFPDALSWLRADRQGVVVVDSIQAAPLLREVGHLAVADARHADRLRRDLTITAPRIEVAAPSLTRAA